MEAASSVAGRFSESYGLFEDFLEAAGKEFCASDCWGVVLSGD
jgi:hypothetical protein